MQDGVDDAQMACLKISATAGLEKGEADFEYSGAPRARADAVQAIAKGERVEKRRALGIGFLAAITIVFYTSRTPNTRLVPRAVTVYR